MLDKNADIVVVGAGAIGGVTAAALKTANWNVQLVCKHREIADLAMSTGLSITGINGNRMVRLDAVPAIADLAGPKDLVLLATKATDCVAAANDLLPFLKPDAVVVSLQNGICEEDIAAVVGRDRVMGCVVGWGASMLGPGQLEITSGGDFIVGNIDNQTDDNLPFVRDLLDNVVPARVSDNGYIVDRGEASGVAVPVNTAVVAMIKQIETGSRKMGPANLEDAAFSDL
jgi:2-dehydropantoate 2-reductase